MPKLPITYQVFKWITLRWEAFRFFAFENRTIFEICFLGIYTFEQAVLIYLTGKGYLDETTVGYYVLIVLFTFALHKIVMESRSNFLDEQLHELMFDYHLIKKQSKDMADRHKEIVQAYGELIRNK